MILTLFSIPISIIWVYTGSILYYLVGIDSRTSELAGYWAKHIVFGLWPTLMFQVIRRYLQGCGILWPVTVANIASAISVLFGTHMLIHTFDMGFQGAAIGVVISQWVRLLVLFGIVSFMHMLLRYYYLVIILLSFFRFIMAYLFQSSENIFINYCFQYGISALGPGR